MAEHQSYSTEEWSPPPVDVDEACDFAQLYPISPEAKEHFSKVVKKFDEDPEWMSHARRFVHYNTEHKGYYRFNLALPPSTGMRSGWVMGTGDPRQAENVDFIVSPVIDNPQIGRRHCSFVFNPHSRVLLIRARHDTIIDGKILLRGSKRTDQRGRADSTSSMAVDTEMGVALGNMMYVLKFTAFSASAEYYERLMATTRSSTIDQRPPLDQVTPATQKIGKWRLWEAKWAGTFGTVFRGYDSFTGSLIVAKRVKRTKSTYPLIKHEIEILRKLGDSHHNVCHFKALWPDGADTKQEHTFAGGYFDEIYLITAPVAAETLQEYKSSSSLNWLILFKDACQGLEYCHQKGIMHRDVKPNNICVSWSPLTAILIDFGHATEEAESRDHMCGTVMFLAPEIIALKEHKPESHHRRPPAYDKAADVWGLGLSFIVAYDRRSRWDRINRDIWSQIIEQWSRECEDSQEFLRQQVLRAISWRSIERPSASVLAGSVRSFLRQQEKKRKHSE